jgi:hypothetical protein
MEWESIGNEAVGQWNNGGNGGRELKKNPAECRSGAGADD